MCILYHIHNDCVIAKYDLNTYNIPYCSDYFRLKTNINEYYKIIEEAKNKNNWLSTTDFYSFIVENDINLEYLSINATLIKKKLKIFI